MAAICGGYLGLTNEPTTIVFNPVLESASRRRVLSAMAISDDSMCMPSRMHVSTMWTLDTSWFLAETGRPRPVSCGALRYNIADISAI